MGTQNTIWDECSLAHSSMMWHYSSVFGTCLLLWVLPYPLALSKSSVIICWIRLIFQSLYTQITQLFGLHMSLNVEKVREVQTQWGIHQMWSIGVFCLMNYEPVFSSVSNEKPDIWLIFLKKSEDFFEYEFVFTHGTTCLELSSCCNFQIICHGPYHSFVSPWHPGFMSVLFISMYYFSYWR